MAFHFAFYKNNVICIDSLSLINSGERRQIGAVAQARYNPI